MPKLSIEETIKAYTNENGFAWGINTVMKSLAPGVSHDLTSAGGTFIIDRWNSPLPQPTSQEIRDTPSLIKVNLIIEKWLLLEYACCAFPAQPHALVQTVHV